MSDMTGMFGPCSAFRSSGAEPDPAVVDVPCINCHYPVSEHRPQTPEQLWYILVQLRAYDQYMIQHMNARLHALEAQIRQMVKP